METSEKRTRRWLGGKIFLSTYIVLSVICFVIGSFLLVFYFECENYRKNYDFEHPVTAVYTKVIFTVADLQTHSFRYYPFYEYTSIDGVYYSGYGDWYYEESTARSYIGEEIEIYIDGNGGSTPWLSYNNQKIWAVAVSVILLTVGVAIIAVLIIPHRWKPPKPPKQKKLPFIGVGPL